MQNEDNAGSFCASFCILRSEFSMYTSSPCPPATHLRVIQRRHQRHTRARASQVRQENRGRML
jgi:hypothetical protein